MVFLMAHRMYRRMLLTIHLSIALAMLFISGAVFSQPQEKIAIGKTLSPAFQRVFNMILQQSEIQTEIVPVPLGRERKLFEQGIIKIECCVVPEWRNSAAEQEVQVFSAPVYVEDQILVTRASNTEFKFDLRHAHSYTLGLIRGFNKDLYQEFERKVEVNNYDALFNMLIMQRVDLVLVGRPEFIRQQFVHNDIFKEVYTYTQYPLRIRVHESVAHLLPQINSAIAQLHHCNAIAPILEGQ